MNSTTGWMFAAAPFASIFSDTLEHSLRYVRSGYRWPSGLPIRSVAAATAVRAVLAVGGVVIFGSIFGTVCNPAGAAIVGFALPQCCELYLGRTGSWGSGPVASDAEQQPA